MLWEKIKLLRKFECSKDLLKGWTERQTKPQKREVTGVKRLSQEPWYLTGKEEREAEDGRQGRWVCITQWCYTPIYEDYSNETLFLDQFEVQSKTDQKNAATCALPTFPIHNLSVTTPFTREMHLLHSVSPHWHFIIPHLWSGLGFALGIAHSTWLWTRVSYIVPVKASHGVISRQRISCVLCLFGPLAPE